MEYVIHMLVAASQECVNPYSTRRAPMPKECSVLVMGTRACSFIYFVLDVFTVYSMRCVSLVCVAYAQIRRVSDCSRRVCSADAKLALAKR